MAVKKNSSLSAKLHNKSTPRTKKSTPTKSATGADDELRSWMNANVSLLAPNLSLTRRAAAVALAITSLAGASGNVRLACRRLERSLGESYEGGPHGSSATITTALRLLRTRMSQSRLNKLGP